jgi:hypothetical protein
MKSQSQSSYLYKLVHPTISSFKGSLVIVIISFLVTVAAVWFALGLEVRSDLAALVPGDRPCVKALKIIEKKFGSSNTLVVLLQSKHEKKIKQFLPKLAQTIEKSPYVKSVEYKLDIDFFKDHSLLYLSQDSLQRLYKKIEARIQKEKLKQNPLYLDLDDEDKSKEDILFEKELFLDKRLKEKGIYEYFSLPKQGIWALVVYPKKGATHIVFAEKFFEDVKQRIKQSRYVEVDPKMRIFYGGGFKNYLDEAIILKRHAKVASLFGIFLIMGVIFFWMPYPVSLLLVSVPLLMGLSWTFAITRLIIGKLNTITVSNFIVLFGMGIDYGLHMFARYREARILGLDLHSGMKYAVGESGRAILTAAFTTAAAFLVLIFAEYKGFVELGFIIGIGILFSLVGAFFVFPPLCVICERAKILKFKVTSTILEERIQTYGRVLPFYRLILILGGLGFVLSILAIPRLGFQYDFRTLQANLAETQKANLYIKEIFKVSLAPAILLAHKSEDLDKAIEALKKKKAELGKKSTIKAIVSLNSFIPSDQEKKLKVIQKIRQLLDDDVIDLAGSEVRSRINKLRRLTEVKSFKEEALPSSLRERFQGRSNTHIAFVYSGVELKDVRQALKFRDEITGVKVQGKDITISSAVLVLAEMVDLMVKDGKFAIILASLVIFLCLLIDFRKIASTVLALLPLAIGMAWMLGIMVLFSFKIDFFNSIVFPTIIGIGVDNCVHIIKRYQAEGVGSLLRVLKRTGRTIFFTTATTVIGFGVLVFGHHPALRSIGALAVIGLICSFLAAFLVLPSILYILERFQAVMLLDKELKRPERIRLFSVTYCPLSRIIGYYFEERKIAYTEIKVDTLPQEEREKVMEEIRRRTGKDSLPVIFAGDISIVGMNMKGLKRIAEKEI